MRKSLPLLIDIVLVIAFCVIGRNSHSEAVVGPGLLRTLWPFGAGLLIGWALALLIATRSARSRFDGYALWPTGVLVWLSTLIGGMVLRVVSGQGTQVSFINVAATVLALFLVGWRVVRFVIVRQRTESGA
ncbi:MAG: DUF3054 domain-containing protein [Nocardia sp.]|nr:DUF3054 domain-containing protein [Nocardia sp.]